jgi:hypothetical protein
VASSLEIRREESRVEGEEYEGVEDHSGRKMPWCPVKAEVSWTYKSSVKGTSLAVVLACYQGAPPVCILGP